MKSVIKSTVISLAVASLAFAGTSAAAAAPAAPGSVTPRIIGGSQAPNTPWEVQLVFVQDGTSYGCTGEAISSEWVLTAKHCVDGISSMNVYYSNSTSNRGPAIAADSVYASSAGDVGLVHLSQSKRLSSYPALADSYQANAGDSGLIMGYGGRANAVRSDGLYQATVKVLGSGQDAYGGNSVQIQGVSGTSNHGDSGGPLIINNKIVAVDSRGDLDDKGSDTHATSQYANLADSRSWITQTSGL